MTLRQFCKEFQQDYPVAYHVCQVLGIRRDEKNLFRIDDGKEIEIMNYIREKETNTKKLPILKRTDKTGYVCSCGLYNEIDIIFLKKNSKHLQICNCGIRTNITPLMIILDN